MNLEFKNNSAFNIFIINGAQLGTDSEVHNKEIKKIEENMKKNLEELNQKMDKNMEKYGKIDRNLSKLDKTLENMEENT